MKGISLTPIERRAPGGAARDAGSSAPGPVVAGLALRRRDGLSRQPLPASGRGLAARFELRSALVFGDPPASTWLRAGPGPRGRSRSGAEARAAPFFSTNVDAEPGALERFDATPTARCLIIDLIEILG